MSTLSGLLPPVQQALIGIGDPMPEFAWTGQDDTPVSLYTDSNCGRMTVLLLCRTGASAIAEIAGLGARAGEFAALGAQIFAVTTDPAAVNRELASSLSLPFEMLSDPALSAGAGFGLAVPGAKWRVVVLDPNVRVERVIGPEQGATPADAALACLKALLVPAPDGIVVSQPPVLTIPNVLEPELCDRLIRVFETGERYVGGLTDGTDGGYAIYRETKIREDVGVPDTDSEGTRIYDNFRKRVFPEIFKAFKYRVTRAESMRVGCYAADDGGRFAPHRDDNVPLLRHRRFGFTINLNAGDYEGGYLRFPEYGPQLYAPASGSMVVFSVSLLHEAMPVTKGKRYGMFGFLFGETEEAWRKQRNPSFDSLVVDTPAGTHHIGRGTR